MCFISLTSPAENSIKLARGLLIFTRLRRYLRPLRRRFLPRHHLAAWRIKMMNDKLLRYCRCAPLCDMPICDAVSITPDGEAEFVRRFDKIGISATYRPRFSCDAFDVSILLAIDMARR